jgi:hypothetical protein
MPAKKIAKKIAIKPMAKKRSVKQTTAKKTSVKPPHVSNEAIAQAAYLNYRRRIHLGLPGDHDTDWLEAERSLRAGS